MTYSCLFLKEFSNVEFLLPLVMLMVRRHPADRVDANSALKHWRRMRKEIFRLALSRLRRRDENLVKTVALDILTYLKRETRQVLTLVTRRATIYWRALCTDVAQE